MHHVLLHQFLCYRKHGKELSGFMFYNHTTESLIGLADSMSVCLSIIFYFCAIFLFRFKANMTNMFDGSTTVLYVHSLQSYKFREK